MYLERYVDSGSDHIFSHQTDVPPKYRPGSAYAFLNLQQLCQQDFHKQEKFLDAAMYPVHPLTAKLYAKLGHTLSPTKYKFVPTSSTRTVLVYADSVEPFFLKLDLPVNISRFNRAINKSDVIFSSQIDYEVEGLSIDSKFSFGFLREVGGGWTKLLDGREAGYITRALHPHWVTKSSQTYYLVPSFAMISPDAKQSSDVPILIQLISSRVNRADFMIENILRPLIDFWFSLAEKGILWELQQQNTLFVLDSNYNPVGIVARDYDAVYIDSQIRTNLSLGVNFNKHLLHADESREIRYSVTFDHRLCKQNLLRLINCVAEYISTNEATYIRQKITEYITETMPLSVASALPNKSWYTIPEILFRNGIKTIRTHNPPLRD